MREDVNGEEANRQERLAQALEDEEIAIDAGDQVAAERARIEAHLLAEPEDELSRRRGR